MDAARKELLDQACGGDCGHTDVEHEAFNDGLEAGEQGIDESHNPHSDDTLAEAWFTGHAVGAGNQESELHLQ